jgi:error-prone DNA polymerase
MVTLRQRPQTASGVTFLTMEDEHGLINVIVWRDVAETYRRVLFESQLLGVDGKWGRLDGACHLVASRLLNMTTLLGWVDVRSRDFH